MAWSESLTLVIHWSRFGPYHLARLQATSAQLRAYRVRVIGLETASRDEVYAWREERVSTDFERYTAFPGRSFERIPVHRMWWGLRRLLGVTNPDVIAISGYSSRDAQVLLGWCKLHRRPAILMSVSKVDDVLRVKWKELAKKLIVRRFSAALCAGTRHRAYLEQLGMARERIVTGYGAVDNDYFGQRADQVRQQPAAFRHLPSLEISTPFFLASSRFIQRKNLHGLLIAYQRYREQSQVCGLSPWRLVVLGDGEERGNLERLIVERDIEEVTFPGFRQIDELPAYYGLARAFIHPALQEQWGLVVNEAMASGLPVLVSERCGCATDLVRDGDTGFKFDPENVEAMASLMVACTCGEVDLVSLGQAARVHISQWGLERFAQAMYEALVIAADSRGA